MRHNRDIPQERILPSQLIRVRLQMCPFIPPRRHSVISRILRIKTCCFLRPYRLSYRLRPPFSNQSYPLFPFVSSCRGSTPGVVSLRSSVVHLLAISRNTRSYPSSIFSTLKSIRTRSLPASPIRFRKSASPASRHTASTNDLRSLVSDFRH